MALLAAAPVAASHDEVALKIGPYAACIGHSSDMMQRAFALRRACFAPAGLSDQDAFDALCVHGVVVDQRTGITCVAFRARLVFSAAELNATYTGMSYDLSPLASLPGPILELGRVCQSPQSDPMALRLAWAALALLVDRNAASALIGCASFEGADIRRHQLALAYLRAHHLGPKHLRPRRKSPLACDLPDGPPMRPRLPALLQSYLGLGGWVSDHAVSDPDLDTVHVFAGLCVSDMPESRKRRLRAIAESARAT